MSFNAPNAVWLHRSQPFRLKNYTALRSNSLVKLCPSSGASLGVGLYSRAYLADTTTLLNSVRAYTALVPIGAPAAMEFHSAQPFRLQHFTAQFGDTLAEVRPGGSRIDARTYPADTPPLLNTTGNWTAFVPVGAPAAVRLAVPEPFRLQNGAAQFSDTLAEVRPGGSRVFGHAFQANALTLMDICGDRLALVPLSAPGAVGVHRPQPFRLQHFTAQLGDPSAEGLLGVTPYERPGVGRRHRG
jgi:hypothetical protein